MRNADVFAILRDEILSGARAPGSRMPTRVELAERFDTTLVTIHRAMSRLAADGFVIPRGRHGTVVNARPPHLCHVALVLPAGLPPGAVGFDVALAAVQGALLDDLGVVLRTYYVSPLAEDDRSTVALAEDLAARRLAGAVLVVTEARWFAALRARAPEARLVVVGDGPELAGATRLWFDYPALMRAGFDRLAACGARRVAVVCSSTAPDRHPVVLPGLAAERGLALRPSWIQGVTINRQTAYWARQAVALLCDRPADERPDGIFVLDDHLLAGCHQAVVEAGLELGRDIHLVSHWNHPLPGVPAAVETVCFDAGAMLRQAVGHVRQAGDPPARGEPLPPMG